MNSDQTVKRLADDELLTCAKNLAAEERKITAKLLSHLMEIERRLLFAKLGYSSLFKYVTEELGFCAASAQMRIASMRLMVAVPEIEEKIVTGSVNLTNLAQAQRFFNHEKKENRKAMSVAEKKQVIEKLEGLSTRDAEKELMALSSHPESFVRPDHIRPVSPTMSEVRFTADQKLLDQIDEVRCLLAHQDANFTMAELMAKMAEITLEKLRSARFATLKNKAKDKIVAHSTKSVVTSRAKSNGSTQRMMFACTESKQSNSKKCYASRSRYIPRPLVRAVFERDGYQCRYQDPVTGHRCRSKFALQIDHVVAFAKGGATVFENLQTKCAAHNAWAAMKEFGRDKIREYRSSKEHAGPDSSAMMSA